VPCNHYSPPPDLTVLLWTIECCNCNTGLSTLPSVPEGQLAARAPGISGTRWSIWGKRHGGGAWKPSATRAVSCAHFKRGELGTDACCICNISLDAHKTWGEGPGGSDLEGLPQGWKRRPGNHYSPPPDLTVLLWTSEYCNCNTILSTLPSVPEGQLAARAPGISGTRRHPPGRPALPAHPPRTTARPGRSRSGGTLGTGLGRAVAARTLRRIRGQSAQRERLRRYLRDKGFNFLQHSVRSVRARQSLRAFQAG
jgi:hypothetical protein